MMISPPQKCTPWSSYFPIHTNHPLGIGHHIIIAAYKPIFTRENIYFVPFSGDKDNNIISVFAANKSCNNIFQLIMETMIGWNDVRYPMWWVHNLQWLKLPILDLFHISNSDWKLTATLTARYCSLNIRQEQKGEQI